MKLTKTKLTQIIKEEIQKMFEAKSPKRPEFKPGDRVKHKEYGKGTVVHQGAAPKSGECRVVRVKWDDSDRVPGKGVGCIEPNLTKI